MTHQTENQTVSQFIAAQGITMRASLSTNPRRPEDFCDSTRWNVVLMRGDLGVNYESMALPYFMGWGHNGTAPTVETVLDSLASDASGIENARGFQDWASEYGYDTDSRKAERTYTACQRLTARLKAFLTPAQYEVLLWHTERE